MRKLEADPAKMNSLEVLLKERPEKALSEHDPFSKHLTSISEEVDAAAS